MLIPYQMLETDTLQRLMEDFVTREGTDNGCDQSLESRVAQLYRQLERGELFIVFHPDSGDTSLARKSSLPREILQELLAGQGD
ncbi:MAG: YheU family protein [Halopseudomonas yangmingensis]|uniref:YheU family protein n=1 Tax=Halopseudomonas yangmingensis TaxID=1720063 RepID=A0A1I4NLV0_9GAMM|nr:YheU family protein [Halopseudomonas yangmingensis]SFM16478.1 hypothetical protein SAMN05216217_101411 [Halopseudomonas yangmingensis]